LDIPIVPLPAQDPDKPANGPDCAWLCDAKSESATAPTIIPVARALVLLDGLDMVLAPLTSGRSWRPTDASTMMPVDGRRMTWQD
jgi:hypothetical protein